MPFCRLNLCARDALGAEVLRLGRLVLASFSEKPIHLLTNPARMCENTAFVLSLTVIHIACTRCDLMKNLQAEIIKRVVAVMLVTAAVVGVSALSMRTPTHNPNALARSLKSIQTDQARSFYADYQPSRNWYVEFVLSGTSESKAATENLKLVAAAL
jgi:hypothetical protein